MNLLEYFNANTTLLTILLVVAVAAVVCLGLYLGQRCQVRRMKEKFDGQRRFYEGLAQVYAGFYAVIHRSDIRVTYLSPNFTAITGLEEDQIYGDTAAFQQIMEPKEYNQLLETMRAWSCQAEPSSMEIEINFYPLGRDQARRGKLALGMGPYRENYLLVLADITSEYKLRQSMREKMEKAAQESAAKTNFLSQMSHEIRTPMNGILGMLRLAQGHIDDAKATGEYLCKAESLSQFLLTLINDILDMSRIESGRMELEQVEFDLFSMADKLTAMFKTTAEDKGLNWVLDMVDFDVRYVIGDEMRLSQVVINFISNALKFTAPGGTITVTFRQMSKIDNKLHLLVCVKDTGKGIKKDFLKHIFTPFQQEDASTAKNYGGSGLGMAIADRIVRLMDGEIVVESEEGVGSEFSVFVALPIADVAQTLPTESTVSPEQEERKAFLQAFSLEGLHILLAEDNEINAEIAQELLEDEGAVVTLAGDGLEAVRLFSGSDIGQYDVILMDIQMPNLDGYGATQEIRHLHRADNNVPIFAMSANAFVEDKRQSLKVGMDGHISKPVDFDEMRRVIGAYLYTQQRGTQL
jgi:signal transduction histidine kinase/CheY-like chemotaxis protein